MDIISLHQVGLAFGGPQLLDNISLQIESGDRICLLGRNGTGKSSLLHLINNDLPPDSGKIIRKQATTTAYVPQEFPQPLTGTIRHYLQQILAAEELESHTADIRIELTLTQMNLDPEAELSTLSGGLKRRVLLAAALVQDPDLLLLDEPTNHLDINAICWLENFLLRLRTTLIFVSHDRTFVRNLANRIVELDRGQVQDYRCPYDVYLERRRDVFHAEEKAWARFDQKLAEEEIWIRKGIKARRTRNMGRVRELQKLREERRQRRERTGEVRMQLDEAAHSGKMVMEAKRLNFKYDDHPIIDSLNVRILRGNRIGLIGPNGSGKTTLLKILTRQLLPTSGKLRHGTNLQIAYFDQLREQLDEDKSVKQNIADDQDQVLIHGKLRHIYGYLKDFLFTPERARTPVRILSGGEKNRLLLAKLFTQPANLLIMDEPTNDLDMETLDLLEELLLDYQGTVLLVSHDRSFLNNVVTSSLIFAGNGQVEEMIGGYDDWLATQSTTSAQPKKEKAKPAQRKKQPRKISFKENKELAELPKKIEALESEQAELHQQMGDPKIYKAGDSSLIRGLKERLQTIETEVEKTYQRWYELEELPE
ncbi:MAG: ATP-binding cassette domain-containing protein [Pseudomonadota bacterium]|nr:ATP-binding cassette domain-containing protein [Pseudomonadota bacterium]